VSTQINVTVDSGGLAERAKQQQEAARQAQLEKERSLNLSAEALDQRVAAQAAKGLSIDGKPLYAADTKQPQIERRPAANRQSLIKISRFYARYGDNAQYLISGDGAQEVAFNLPPALQIPTFPVLENDSPYPLIPFPPATSLQLIAQRDTLESEAPQINYIETYIKRRVVHTKSSSSLLSLPLGSGNMLIVRFRYFAYASVFTRHYWNRRDVRDDSIPLYSLTLEDQSFTAETETDWVEQEDWIGAIVGEKIARAVVITDSLKQAIKNESVSSEPFTTYGTSSLVCNYAANDTNPEQNGNYSTGIYQCIGYPGTYGYTFYNNVNDKGPAVALTADSPLAKGKTFKAVNPRFSAYGLSSSGGSYYTEFSGTPISWFDVDSDVTRAQMENASTHEQLRSVQLQGGSVLGDLLKPKQYINFSPLPVAWAGQSFTGSVTVYPANSDPGWRGKVRVNDQFLEQYDVHYISDWGQSGFCQQQAARYGITL
jgi:hypothetical protein